ncbi:MAG: hypothetical protein HC915_18610 [Anaerolineae bacterium]|nr:hypothetical protein [Anaerolineae bacterium]
MAMAPASGDDAQAALDHAAAHLPPGLDAPLLLNLYLTQLEIANIRQDRSRFTAALAASRELPAATGDRLLRGRIALISAAIGVASRNGTAAVHEAERAHRIFRSLGATFWQRKAQELLDHYALLAPGYVAKGHFGPVRVGQKPADKP